MRDGNVTGYTLVRCHGIHVPSYRVVELSRAVHDPIAHTWSGFDGRHWMVVCEDMMFDTFEKAIETASCLISQEV